MSTSSDVPAGLMPAVFIGHGSPMNTLESNRYTDVWRRFGASIPRPRAVLVISAHWYIGATAVTAMPTPRTIHDFYGFPNELFTFEYPAPGAPDVAAEVVDAVAPMWVGLDLDGWGLDHGTWSVLAHVFPNADVPVVQLSINASEPLAYHLELGRRLDPLRGRGVLVLGSGNVVHNLGRIDWGRPDTGFDWARRFDDATLRCITDSPGDIESLAAHSDFDLAVPTSEHFVPLVYLAGLADAEGATCGVLVDGFSYGSISMTAYTLGAAPVRADDSGGAASIPATPPPDQTNI